MSKRKALSETEAADADSTNISPTLEIEVGSAAQPDLESVPEPEAPPAEAAPKVDDSSTIQTEEPAPPSGPQPSFLRIGPLKAFQVRPGEYRSQGPHGAPSVAVVASGDRFRGTATMGQLVVAHVASGSPEAARAALEDAVGVSSSAAAKRFRELIQW